MFKNYLSIIIKNLGKNKIYSLINISGLAIGMAACFFIYQYVRFELSYDKFNKNIDRLYRVPISYEGALASSGSTATNHPAVGPAMKAEIPGVEDFVRLAPKTVFLQTAGVSYTDSKGNIKRFNEEKFFLADSSFFTIFTFSFIAGDPATALAKANTAVITESIAKKYFNNEPAINKIIEINKAPITVTGVIKDVPENSHVKFDFLVSMNTVGEKFAYTEWGWPEFYNYVLLKKGTDPKSVEAKLPALIDKYLGKKMAELKSKSNLWLQPVKDIHLRSDLRIELESNGSERTVYFLSILGVLILAVAWINYINLSTAKSLERAKEVGLKKVIGATKKQLIAQFMFESVLVNLFALILAAVIVIVFASPFDEFVGKKVSESFFASGLLGNWLFWLSLVAIFMIGAVQVGAYPAFVLSAFRPALVLKGKFSQSAKGIRVRRALVTLQFSLSIILIAGSIIVYKQLSFMQETDPGYNKNQVLVVKAPAITDSTFQSKVEVFKAALRNNPAIAGVAPSTEIPGKTIFARNDVRKLGDDHTMGMVSGLVEIDESFIPTYQVPLAAGTNIPVNDPVNMFESKNTRVLVNEELAKSLGYKDNQSAIGQYILLTSWFGDIKGEIVGVVKNYHQRSLKEKYQRILYYYNNRSNWGYFSVNIKAKDRKGTLSYIERTYNDIFSGNAFESFFLDEFFNRQYVSDQRFGKIFTLFTILAIVIACIGLIGLSTFAIKIRTKEIGLRKVLGASIPRIVYLFYKDFISLIAIAAVISIPVVYLAAENWLNNFAFRIPLNWSVFIISPLILVILSLLTIGVQSTKAALLNPVKTLRVE